jgi:hypothetical protein
VGLGSEGVAYPKKTCARGLCCWWFPARKEQWAWGLRHYLTQKTCSAQGRASFGAASLLPPKPTPFFLAGQGRNRAGQGRARAGGWVPQRAGSRSGLALGTLRCWVQSRVPIGSRQGRAARPVWVVLRCSFCALFTEPDDVRARPVHRLSSAAPSVKGAKRCAVCSFYFSISISASELRETLTQQGF